MNKTGSKFAIKAICGAFLVGVVFVGCEGGDGAKVIEPVEVQKMENKTQMEEDVNNNAQSMDASPGDDG